MTRGKRLLAVGLAALLGGCALLPPSAPQLLDNLVVHSPPLKRNLVLRDGQYRDRASNVYARLIRVAEGELGGDRGRDAAAVMEVISASAGTHYQLVSVVTVNGRRQASSIYLGKRLELEGLAIENGQVRLALKRPHPGEVTPTRRVAESYRWQGNRLQEVMPTLAGRWELVELWGRPLRGELPWLRFDERRATGFGGCNEIAIDFQAREKAIRFDGVSGGQKWCADTPEEDFIGALIQVDRYGWKGGVLELYSGQEVLARLRAAQ